MEAEAWPCLWIMTHEAGIPLFLFNFHISQKSAYRWSKFSRFFQRLYGLTEQRFTGCSHSLARFQALAPGLPMTFVPSLKYASPPLSYKMAKKDGMVTALAGRPFWIASCVHEPEEELILSVHRKLRLLFPNLLLFYAPRHLERIPLVLKKALEDGPVQKRSQDPMPDSKSSLYLIDTMGELGLFYAFNPFVVLGGSFCPVGGHNIVEPTALGCGVIHGPLMANTLDIVDDFQQAAVQVNEKKLYKEVLNFLYHPEEAKAMAARGQAIIKEKQEQVSRIITTLVRELSFYIKLK